MKLSEAFFASIISLIVSSKTVETDKIWRGNSRPKWIHLFVNNFSYVKLILLEHVYGWYLKIAKQLSSFFFFSFSYNKSLINFSCVLVCCFFSGGGVYTGFLFPLLVICGVLYFLLQFSI